MLTYQPIIDFIEGGGKFARDECGGINNDNVHPLLKRLQDECQEKFGVEYLCVLGASDLEVAIVDGPVRITEYDGNESYITPGGQEWM